MNLFPKDYKIIVYLLILFLGVELISALSLSWPLLNYIFFAILVIIFIYVSLTKLENGIFILLAELVIGSKGYLFYWPLNDDFSLSLRLVLWSAYMLIFIFCFLRQTIKQSWQSTYLVDIKRFSLARPFLLFSLILFGGLISAFLYGNDLSNIFLDFNAWLYFLLLVPLITVKPNQRKLLVILLAAVIWMSLKTLLLLGIFSYNFPEFSLYIYRWLRVTLVGEMTLLSGWNRVFIQSQIFVVIAYFFLFFKNLEFVSWSHYKTRRFWLNLSLASLFMSTIIISLSRSFWLAAAITLLICLIFIAIKYNKKTAVKSILFIFISLAFSFILIRVVTPLNAQSTLEQQLVDRVSEKNEAAVSSRWSLLPELIRAIKKNPITGQGFGTTVTYISQDPRVLEQNEDGLYTTFAFEWGYLDIWLKIGIIGLLVYLWLIAILIKKLWHQANNNTDIVYYALLAGMIFLVAVHMFTPYLNHPLGIGYILLASCLISQNKVY